MNTKKNLKKRLLSLKPVAGHCIDCGRDRAGTTINRFIEGVERTVFVCHACHRHEKQPRAPRLTKAERIREKRAAATV